MFSCVCFFFCFRKEKSSIKKKPNPNVQSEYALKLMSISASMSFQFDNKCFNWTERAPTLNIIIVLWIGLRIMSLLLLILQVTGMVLLEYPCLGARLTHTEFTRMHCLIFGRSTFLFLVVWIWNSYVFPYTWMKLSLNQSETQSIAECFRVGITNQPTDQQTDQLVHCVCSNSFS